MLLAVVLTRLHFFEVVLRIARPDERRLGERALRGLQLRAADPHTHPLVRARPEHVLGLLRVRDRQDATGARTRTSSPLIVETGLVGAVLFGLFIVWVFARLKRARQLGRALTAARDPLAARVRPLAWGFTAALAGTIAANAFYLTMQFYYFYALLALALDGARRVCAPRMKVVALATSYPRDANDVAGRFVADAVEAVRAQGVDVDVVSPARFRHFGIAYGAGIAQNLRAAPWKLALVPAFLVAYARAARAAARDADLVHAHWIPSAIAARATGKPYVLQVWGTDVELARRAPALVRPLVRGARAGDRRVDVPRGRGARARRARRASRPVRRRPARRACGAPEEPPHVLFAGRLSEEKGVLEFVEATEGLPRVIVGDGPLRDARAGGGRLRRRRPSSARTTSARRSSACRRGARATASRRARRWRTAGRSSRSRVGGLVDLDGKGVVLVPPRDPAALRAAIERLLGDAAERERLGALARETAATLFSHERCARSLIEVYEASLRAT